MRRLSICAFLALLISPMVAHSYSIIGSKGHVPFYLRIDTCSFSDVTKRQSVESAVNEAASLTSNRVLQGYTHAYKCGLMDKWVSEIALVDARYLDAKAIGVTYLYYDYSWYSLNYGIINESDIAISTVATWKPLNPAWPAGDDGHTVTLHEIGHTLGLGHSTALAVMWPTALIPLVGGTGRFARFFPDDVAGLRSIYGSIVPMGFEVSVSSHLWTPNGPAVGDYALVPKDIYGNVLFDSGRTVPRRYCRGQTIGPLQFTLLNRGFLGDGSFLVEVSLSTLDYWNGGYTSPRPYVLGRLWYGSGYAYPYSSIKQDFVGTIPWNVPNGDYNIYIENRWTGGLLDAVPGNNITHSLLRVRVDC